MKVMLAMATTALVTACLAVGAAGPAAADVPQCNGQDATIVIDQPDDQTTSRQVEGTDGDDVIVVTADDLGRVDALAGDDSVCVDAPGGSWEVNGGDGADHLEAGPGSGAFQGGAGHDTMLSLPSGRLAGGNGDDVLTGGDGTDVLTAGPGDDEVDGGASDDIIVGEPGSGDDDTFHGGLGQDSFWISGLWVAQRDACPEPGTQVPVTVDLADGTITGGASGTFDDFELYAGGSGVNTWWGTHTKDEIDTRPCGRSLIHGRGGEDHVYAEANRSQVWGGGQDDWVDVAADGLTVHGGPGDDRFRGFKDTRPTRQAHVHGGRGRDVVSFNNDWRHERGRVDLLAGTALQIGTKTPVISQLTGVEDVEGGGGDDVLLGDGSDNHLQGLGGDDRIDGRGGRDRAWGGPGVNRCRAEVQSACLPW